MGIKTALLTITDNATPATQVISMTGTTVAAANTTASISSSALTFSTPILTNSQVQTLTLSNTGSTPLMVYVGAIRLTGSNLGPFALVRASANNCLSVSGVSVPARGSCALDVQHKPSAAAKVGASYTATLLFNLNVPVNPSVSLTGTLFTGLNTYYIHSDHLDSPRSITNTAGQEVWRWDNTDPFGNNIANENPANQGTFTFNLRFPGQYFDRETGLHYNVNRDYNPAVGRYVESDPIGLRGGINTFGYVGGNPLRWVDPTGLVLNIDPALQWIIDRLYKSSIARGIMENLQKSEKTYNVQAGVGGAITDCGWSGCTIKIDLDWMNKRDYMAKDKSQQCLVAEQVMEHELEHAASYEAMWRFSGMVSHSYIIEAENRIMRELNPNWIERDPTNDRLPLKKPPK